MEVGELAKRVDGNQRDLVEYIRKKGGSFTHTYELGKGRLDGIVGIYGFNEIVEIKTEKGKLNKDQIEWTENWHGSWRILRTNADVDDMFVYYKWLEKKMYG